MPSQITKQFASAIYSDSNQFAPSIDSILGNGVPPVGGTTPAVATFDAYNRTIFNAFAAVVPNMGIPATSTLLGLKFLIFCQQSGHGVIYNSDDTGNIYGVIGMTVGTPVIEEGSGHELLVSGAQYRSNIDAFPAGVGNVTPAEVITLGGDTSLWGMTAADLKAQLNNNTGDNKLHLLFDLGECTGLVGDDVTQLVNSSVVTAFGGIGWTGNPATVLPANTIANGTASGWATKSVQSFTASLQGFSGLTVDFGSIAIDADITVTDLRIRMFAQSVTSGGANAGRVTVDGTSTGSKTVQHSGQCGVTKGSTISYANLLANSSGKTRKRHIDNITTAAGNIAVTEYLEFGNNDASGTDLFGYADSDAVKAALFANSGDTKLGFFLDDGIFWKDGNNCTREVAAVVLYIYGHRTGELATREIAAIVAVATYSNPTLYETCEQLCSAVWAAYKATQTRHSIRLHVPTSTSPNDWAVVDPAAAGNNQVVYNNQFHHEIDLTSYVTMQRSARVLADKLNDYQADSLDCTAILAAIGVREITPPA